MIEDTKGKSPIEFQAVRMAALGLIIIIVAHGLFAGLAYGSLPETIPIHFDASGNPDGFAGASIGSWFLMWFVSLGCGLLFGVFSLKLDTIPPRHLSMPRRDEFLALPTPARCRVLAAISFHMLVFTGILMLFFLSMHVCMALAAHGIVKKLPVMLMYGGVFVILLDTILMTVRIVSAVNREINDRVRG
ncbi:MAG: DUF1648 domain-containing protein [Deltaproteobacteria bacterium]|nr:DUF1648 domain-containing protein [Deltaproteobacteria bacterium]